MNTIQKRGDAEPTLDRVGPAFLGRDLFERAAAWAMLKELNGGDRT